MDRNNRNIYGSCDAVWVKASILILLLLPAQVSILFAEVQWATKVIGYSSQFSDKQYSALQALGKPSVIPGSILSSCAWTPLFNNDSSKEWITVGFDKPMNVSRIAISENNIGGGIHEVFLIDTAGMEKLVYITQPSFKKPIGSILNISISKTAYKVSSLKITLNYIDPQYKYQLDAIAISDEDLPVNAKINIVENAKFETKPENPGEKVNSPYSELLPVISPQGDVLYFTRSDHPANTGSNRRNDIWYSNIAPDGKFSKCLNIENPINNEYHNFAFSVTQDGNGLLIGNRYLADGGMVKGASVSYKTKDGWSFPDSIVIRKFKNLNSNAGYFLASSGRDLILSLEMDDSRGGTDLYVSHLMVDGTWSEPENLGDKINTAADESGPFLASDGVTLYFSTQGFPGYGDNDIFISRRLDSSWTNWGEPQNLGNTINSKSWEGYFTIPASGDYAYFVTDKNSIGEEDIFRIKIPPELKPKAVVLVKGRVVESNTGKPLEAGIMYEILPSGIEAGIARSNPSNGEYSIVLPAGNKYGFLAQAKGYVPINENLDLRNVSIYEIIDRDLKLVPMEVGQIIRINNIFFEFGKYDLLEDSFSELRRVIKFLNENPGIKIEISGHTDDVGTPKSNLALSLNRAKSVSKFLTDGGIDIDRFIVRGFGQSQPVAPNDTDENRQMNRRVEFKILDR